MAPYLTLSALLIFLLSFFAPGLAGLAIWACKVRHQGVTFVLALLAGVLCAVRLFMTAVADRSGTQVLNIHDVWVAMFGLLLSTVVNAWLMHASVPPVTHGEGGRTLLT